MTQDPAGRRPRVVLVDDHPGMLRLLTIRLKSEGYDVSACESAAQALTTIPRYRPDVLITDLRMADLDGIGLLRELQRRYPGLPVILLTAHGTIPDAVEATKSGAFAFLTKPVDKEQLLEQLGRAVKVSGFASADDAWRAGIVTRSPVMEDRLSRALQAAGTAESVLLLGQPGTGKKRLAKAIHRASQQRKEHFAVIACSTLTSADLEQLLGASADPPVGTLLIDEVADLDIKKQTHLAQLLESDVEGRPRLIASSARDLRAAMAKGLFRDDLFYRLGVIQVDMPPLSQRREDIPLLAAHFLEDLAQDGSKHVLAPEAVELLMAADWPGNVAQLKNLVRQAAALAAGPVISAEVVQQALGDGSTARVSTFSEARDEFTRNYLAELLLITGGNVTHAAKLAGRNRTDFYKLLARHNLQPDDYKQR